MTRSLLRLLLAAALVPLALPGAGAAALASEGTSALYSVDWEPCPGSAAAECGTLTVPLDWSDPGGERITVAVARRPADRPEDRVGTLFYNPGGPGDGGVQYVMIAEQIFSDALRARFDIVAMDPRGVGASTPVTCAVAPLTPEHTLWPTTEQQFEDLTAHNRAVGESCLAETGPLLGHLDTVSAARDHEALRLALGVDEVSWLGISYGTQLAANYAELYPGHTRAMALDAALEHSLPETVQLADEISAAEASFNRFAAWCGTADSCALRGQDVAAVFDQLVAAADQNPIPVEGALRPVTGEDIRMGTKGLLRFKEPSIYGPDLSWAGLSRALAAARAGDATAFALPPAQNQAQAGTLLGIACMEYEPQVHTFEQMHQRIQLGKQLAPHLQGASETWQVSFCIDWPLEPSNPPRALHVEDVPALLVHATFDPSDPYRWSHSLAAQIEGSHVLTREGDGHTSYYTSPCARGAVDAFLVDLVVPEREVCD